MEQKINLVELLKDCPKGMELDCVMFVNPVLLNYISNDVDDTYPIGLITKQGNEIELTKYGSYADLDEASCIIFPKGKTTWDGFHIHFKDGDIIFTRTGDYNWVSIFKQFSGNDCCTYIDLCINDNDLIIDTHCLCNIGGINVQRLATEGEKEKLFQAIKDNGYRWNPKTKTLEKLVTDKFDITTLKPFDKVLTRTTNSDVWGADLFGLYKDGWFLCNGHIGFRQCIPYKENEHLLGTTNDCDEFYKTW